jgi:hypothetical protein
MLKAAQIRTFPSRVTIKMTAPVYAPMRPRDSTQPNKMEEIFRNTPKEKATLAKVLHNAVISGLRNYRAKRTRKL